MIGYCPRCTVYWHACRAAEPLNSGWLVFLFSQSGNRPVNTPFPTGSVKTWVPATCLQAYFAQPAILNYITVTGCVSHVMVLLWVDCYRNSFYGFGCHYCLFPLAMKKSTAKITSFEINRRGVFSLLHCPQSTYALLLKCYLFLKLVTIICCSLLKL